MKKKIISYFFLIIIITFICYYFKKNSYQIIKIIVNINKYCIYLFLPLAFINLYINSLNNKYILKFFNVNLKFKDYFSITSISSLLNIIIPFRGGVIFKAYYLKEKYKFNYSKSVVMNLAVYNITFLVCSFLGIINLLILKGSMKFNINKFLILIIFYFFILISSSFLILYQKKTIKFPIKKLTQIINNILSGWHLLKNKKSNIIFLFTLNVFAFIVFIFQTMLAFKSINISLNIFQLIFICTIALLSVFINITPGNLGVQEAVFSFSSYLLHIKLLDSIIVSLIIRFLNLIITFFLALISFLYLFYLKKTEKIN